jgi:hypothetical protein
MAQRQKRVQTLAWNSAVYKKNRLKFLLRYRLKALYPAPTSPDISELRFSHAKADGKLDLTAEFVVPSELEDSVYGPTYHYEKHVMQNVFDWDLPLEEICEVLLVQQRLAQ